MIATSFRTSNEHPPEGKPPKDFPGSFARRGRVPEATKVSTLPECPALREFLRLVFKLRYSIFSVNRNLYCTVINVLLHKLQFSRSKQARAGTIASIEAQTNKPRGLEAAR